MLICTLPSFSFVLPLSVRYTIRDVIPVCKSFYEDVSAENVATFTKSAREFSNTLLAVPLAVDCTKELDDSIHRFESVFGFKDVDFSILDRLREIDQAARGGVIDVDDEEDDDDDEEHSHSDHDPLGEEDDLYSPNPYASPGFP